jgi:hypothetical protein
MKKIIFCHPSEIHGCLGNVVSRIEKIEDSYGIKVLISSTKVPSCRHQVLFSSPAFKQAVLRT